jgi:hypothetical protein
MVEGIRARVSSSSPQPDGEDSRSAVQPGAGKPARVSGWDPYEVWVRQVKQARQRHANLDTRLTAKLGYHAPSIGSARIMAADDASKWRNRLSAFLPRFSG